MSDVGQPPPWSPLPKIRRAMLLVEDESGRAVAIEFNGWDHQVEATMEMRRDPWDHWGLSLSGVGGIGDLLRSRHHAQTVEMKLTSHAGGAGFQWRVSGLTRWPEVEADRPLHE